MAYIDYTSSFGMVLLSINNMTGSLFLSLLYITLILCGICIGFGLPPEFIAPILLPILLGALVVTSQLLPVLAIVVVYVAIIVAKKFL